MTDFEYEVDAIIESYISEFEPVNEISDQLAWKAAFKAKEQGKFRQYDNIKHKLYLRAIKPPKGVSAEEMERRRRASAKHDVRSISAHMKNMRDWEENGRRRLN